MQGVLYISHGSRVPKARSHAVQFLNETMPLVEAPLQEICYLELAKPTIAEGIETLVTRGATRIAVVPVLLLSGGHYYKDIPQAINKAAERFSDITFTYGKTLGVQERIIEILLERVHETHVPVTETTDILLVGRGSPEPETKTAIETITGRLHEQLKPRDTHVSYLAAREPSFSQALENLQTSAAAHTIVIPYLWFTGILLQHMAEKLDEVRAETTMTAELGHHPLMHEALASRAHEAIHAPLYQGGD
ncbi:sirohydrochlorin ferrochelatase [Salsuginibacillus halophilus]|uniref:Sirohydrochlorin ferrochelatase n=1 Tax=Salsuginibacillus halophilus TaxID=517424 RepID=A0A2P8H9P1_9BACI|nr:sirohydrochlorin chelatase [Salsuginibacillus halophilus]PSL42956.1 sirohydrochlorin ferrochelatase [Salsuginibacillus halophilus]